MATPKHTKTIDVLSGDACLPDLLSEQVRAHPERTAVSFGNESLTFAELEIRIAELAAYLQHLGVGEDDFVGIFLEPSIETVVAAWGVLSAGGAYLPLSPEYPEDRLRYMVEDARPKVVLAQEGLVRRLAELAPAGTRVVTPRDVAAFGRRGPVAGGPRPDGLAYVVYTSGSTGRPKGVLVEHRSVVNQLRWLADTYQLDEHSTILQKTPMSFDAAQWEILAPAFGSHVVVGAPGSYRDPELLIDTINRYGVTTLQCVPTLLQALLDTERLHTATSLTRIFSGGEALSRTLARQTVAELASTELVNLYGPTECTINSSAFTVDRDLLAEGPETVSIGAPVANTEYYVFDENRVPVGVGEVGELYIGGVQLARGYLNQPELTAERFVDHPAGGRLYRTGDRVYRNADGTVQYSGRTDNQVKLRGFRVELDEIKHAVEAHDWVRNAAVVVKRDPHTGFQNLVACVELNPREAALMDQGNHGAHHQSKQSRLQVRAQLSNPGCRDDLRGRHVVDLPGQAPTERQRARVFARKTYRYYEGGDVTKADILRALARQVHAADARDPGGLSLAELGEIIRYFGQFHSDERLLPKYGYASPGALYATQLYLELDGVAGLRPGFYYYHPVYHQLVLIRAKAPARPGFRLHLAGRKSAIEPVYRNNIQEVLEIEAGHLVGLFEEILPEYGMDVTAAAPAPSIMDKLEVAAEDYYLGTFDLVPHTGRLPDETEIYVQAHPGRIADLPAGQYRYEHGDLRLVSAELVEKKHVIAINQQAYERAGFGVTVLGRNQRDGLRYVDLGRTLQRLMMNDSGLGFMSSGYSSETGHDLPSHRRIDSVLGGVAAPSYFFVGGRVSEEQLRSTGMKEDAVHMKGPTELIKDDLATFLPDYMLPNKVVVLDALPLTANGKIDVQALERSALTDVGRADRPVVAPRTPTEQRVAAIWAKVLRRDTVSVADDFFEAGGNSLTAVGLVNRVNKEFGTALPLQVLFAAPTVEKLATRVERGGSASRLVRLATFEQSARPVFCWPGLGGFTMNLRRLAVHNGLDRPFYGVQAHGVNEGETPYATIEEMAAADVAAIRRVQPAGPYTLWGYSFGARVAFETAYQLEQAGERVEHLFLIAPGSPKLDVAGGVEASYADAAFVTILFSVFAGGIDHPALAECLRAAEDDESFARFVSARFDLDPDLVRRITGVVRRTYGFRYEFHELARRKVNAPITIFKAQGDDYSFIENSSGYSAEPPAVVELDADHYGLLTGPGLGELAASIQQHLLVGTKETVVPHVSIKHFPISLSEERQEELVEAVTKALTSAFECDEGVISIALEPVARERWTDQVYIPEIVNRKDLLRKSPNY